MKKNEQNFCKLCLKNYASKSSLCNHNKKFHSMKNNNIPNNQICNYCKKGFSHPNSRWRHEKTCKEKARIEKEKDRNEKMEEFKLKNMELRLKEREKRLNSSTENMTVSKLNKMLQLHNQTIENSTVNSNVNSTVGSYNTTNNIVNNIHFQMVGFGKEDGISMLLTEEEKNMILNSRRDSLQKLVNIIHCGKYNQFKNILITNMKNDFAHLYDEKEGKYVLGTKDEIIQILLNNRLSELENMTEELKNDEKMNKMKKVQRTIEIMEKFIEDMSNEYNEDKDMLKDREKRINDILLMLHKNVERNMQDIAALLSNDVEPITIQDEEKEN
jgi:hypothetical protein